MDNNVPRILVIHTSSDERLRLKNLLERNNACDVVDEADNLNDGWWLEVKCDIDLLLIASDLINQDALGSLRARILSPDAQPVIAFGVPESAKKLRQYNRIGIVGFIGRGVPDIEYTTAVKTVLRGGSYFSPILVDALFKRHTSQSREGNTFSLTNREMEILSLLANGYCNKEIANTFDLSVRTVETHRFNIRRKTAANTLSDLVKVARELDIIHLDKNPNAEIAALSQDNQAVL